MARGGSAVGLRPAEEDDLAYVERFLTANDLPAADVRTTPGRFYVAYRDGARVGVGGLERYGRGGLLRSVVVEPASRGRGVGSALCDALETTAADQGIETLYLLTTTAAGFFADRGYVEVDRADAPTAIRETAEFADLCPTTATCMAKSV